MMRKYTRASFCNKKEIEKDTSQRLFNAPLLLFEKTMATSTSNATRAMQNRRHGAGCERKHRLKRKKERRINICIYHTFDSGTLNSTVICPTVCSNALTSADP